jgi:hypothetical protein
MASSTTNEEHTAVRGIGETQVPINGAGSMVAPDSPVPLKRI